MEAWTYSRFVERKIHTTVCLQEKCKGTYGDISLILCAIISAMASVVWPGRNIDRRRFVQLLVKCIPETKTISVPRIVAGLTKSGLTREEDLLESKFHLRKNCGRIYTGPEIDVNEDDMLLLLGSSSDLEIIRKYSYASLLYTQIRCSYSHEFKSGNEASPFLMTSLGETCISYDNDMNSKYPSIHFGLDWLANLCLKGANAVDSINTPLAEPSSWWIDGS